MSNEKYYQRFLENNPHPRKLKYYSAVNGSTDLQLSEQRLVNFSSNDYLGLSKHPLLIQRSREYAEKWGVGSSSSRLVTGNYDFYNELEDNLAKALHKPAALILGSGYQTNISVLEALLDPVVLGAEPLVFCDRYCHNSLLNMTRHLGRLHRFPHQDLVFLEKLLQKHQDLSQPKFIIVESLYSMDGDKTDFPALIRLAKKYQAMLYVDDAHAVGVYGESGWGIAPEFADDIDIIMGTFSKGLGSFGGYIGCSEVLKDYLINKCRGLIYSTALSPAVLGAIAGGMEILPELGQERIELLKKAEDVREFFYKNNLNIGNSDSHIIPWVIGDADLTLRISQRLEALGVLGITIRPPTVPVGMSRIRFCLSVLHGEKEIGYLKECINVACYCGG